jgi:uncharacterized membrane protein
MTQSPPTEQLHQPWARLVGLTGPLSGRVATLERQQVLIGRVPGCDVVVDDPHVSRRHAELRHEADGTSISDLGSTSGTLVNQRQIQHDWPLRDGDTVTVGGVSFRFEDGAHRPAAPRQRPEQAVDYRIGDQQAGTISNVGRDQYVTQQRESFLREVAATRTRARVLIWLGAALSVAGFATWAGNILSFIRSVSQMSPTADPGDLRLLGPDVLGVPVAVLGFGLTFIGMVLMVLGIVLHIVSSARRRGFERGVPASTATRQRD